MINGQLIRNRSQAESSVKPGASQRPSPPPGGGTTFPESWGLLLPCNITHS